MKKTIRKSAHGVSAAELVAAIRQVEEAQRTGVRSKRQGFAGRLTNHLLLTKGDARQWLNTLLFGGAGWAAWQYYLGHMNAVWTVGILAILFSLPLIGLTRLILGFWRDRERAQEAGGPLAVHNFQFIFSFVPLLAGTCMYIFREQGSIHAASDANTALGTVVFGAGAATYNYILGRRYAEKTGGVFPRLRGMLHGMNGKRLAQR